MCIADSLSSCCQPVIQSESPSNSHLALPPRFSCLQWKVDKDGANIGILWDNRTRPHHYSKPGEAGLAAGLSSM
jgi:hypothetical protein